MVALTVTGIIAGLILLDVVASNIYGKYIFSGSKASRERNKGRTPVFLVKEFTGVSVSRGMFHHRGHTWAHWRPDGQVLVGADDLLHRIIGRIDEIRCPATGSSISQGEKAVMIRQGERVLYILSPVTGVVSSINHSIESDPGALRESPYERGWIFEVTPTRAVEDIRSLMLSETAEEWIVREERRIRRFIERRLRTAEWDLPGGLPDDINGILEHLGEETWILFKDQFIYQQEWRT